MVKVKDASKKAQAFMQKSDNVDMTKCLELKDIISEVQKVGEDSIQELTSEEISQYISNY